MSKVKNKKKKKYRGFWRFIKIQIFFILLVLAGTAYYFLGGYAAQIKSLQREADTFVNTSTSDTFKASQTSVVYDANGDQISVLKGEKDVYYLTYDQMPANVTAAIVSIEDKKFYKHNGVDYKAILRAVYAMVKNGQVTQGASTITQQLARNIFLSQEKTWQRKMEEIFISQRLEKKYTKNEILEFYLNNIYFGNGYYGIQAASKGYFNATVDQLDLSQIAFLCAIPNNPTLYDPVNNMDNTLTRRNRILKNMYEDGKITATAYSSATAEGIELNRPQASKNDYVETYTYYCATRALMKQQGFEFQYEFDSDSARDAYNTAYDELYTSCQKTLYTAGYRIYTSIDLNIQSELQSAVDENLSGYTDVNEEGVYQLQSSAVCIDNENGFVKAIVGGRSQDLNGYTLNRAYQSFRQPGSSIKPLIVYTPSLERGYTPDSIVTDQKIEDGPSNADGGYSGEMTLRSAVQRSKNTVAWQLFDELTPEVGLSYIKNMNFAKLDARDEQLSASLGGFTNGVSALEMASGYETIENNGNYRMPTCIMKITDANGNDLIVSEQEETQIYKENAARMMTDMLKSVMESGTAKGLDLGDMPSAGKTGTTNDNKDGWFAGYTRYYTTAVWVGYDMPKELPTLKGATYPGNIWHDFMLKIHEDKTPIDFLPYVSYSDSKHSGSTSDDSSVQDDTKQNDTKQNDAGNTDVDTGNTDGANTDGNTVDNAAGASDSNDPAAGAQNDGTNNDPQQDQTNAEGQ